MAVAARVESARRRRIERHGVRPRRPSRTTSRIAWTSSIAVDEELGRLPEKYRAPIVLCYLEGLTHDRPPTSSAGRSARSAAGSPGPATCCVPD